MLMGKPAKQSGELCQAENGMAGLFPAPSSGEKLGFCEPVSTMFSKDASSSLLSNFQK